jgi:hypothetical protein
MRWVWREFGDDGSSSRSSLGSVDNDLSGPGDSLMTSQPSLEVSSVAGITDALAGLEDLDELPTAAHVARLRALHNALTQALSSIDEI